MVWRLILIAMCAAGLQPGPWLKPPFARRRLPVLYLCLQGPGVDMPGKCGGLLDYDGDGDIDLADFCIIQREEVTDIPCHWWFSWTPPCGWQEYLDYRRRMFKDFPVLMGGPGVVAPCKARMMFDADDDCDIDLRDFACLQVAAGR